MKTKHYKFIPPSHLTEDEWIDKTMELLRQTNSIEAFSIDDRYFSGNRAETIQAYLHESPSKPFIIWLIDNGLEIHN